MTTCSKLFWLATPTSEKATSVSDTWRTVLLRRTKPLLEWSSKARTSRLKIIRPSELKFGTQQAKKNTSPSLLRTSAELWERCLSMTLRTRRVLRRSIVGSKDWSTPLPRTWSWCWWATSQISKSRERSPPRKAQTSPCKTVSLS